MILKEIFYAVKCNRCGDIHEDGEHSFWSDESTAEEYALDSDWIELNGKHYCPNCYKVDEETDEISPLLDYPVKVNKIKMFIEKIVNYHVSVHEEKNCFVLSFYDNTNTGLPFYDESYINRYLGDSLLEISHKRVKGCANNEWTIKIKNS